MGSQPFFIVPKITTEFFILPKKSLPQNKIFKKITTEKIKFLSIMIFCILFTAVVNFLENFVVIFPKKITTTVVIFLEKTSPANFKNSPANNFGVRARLRTPDVDWENGPIEIFKKSCYY